MIRADFNYNKNGIKATGYFKCVVTSFAKMTFYPVDFVVISYSGKGDLKLEELKNECWDSAIPQIY